jgi:hypothetical protein
MKQATKLNAKKIITPYSDTAGHGQTSEQVGL